MLIYLGPKIKINKYTEKSIFIEPWTEVNEEEKDRIIESLRLDISENRLPSEFISVYGKIVRPCLFSLSIELLDNERYDAFKSGNIKKYIKCTKKILQLI